MHNAQIFLAQERILEAQRAADQLRLVRQARHRPSLRDRLRHPR